MDFFGIGPPEILLVLLLVFVIFGPKKLVEMSRNAGKAMRNLNRSAADITRKLEDELTPDNKPGPPVEKRGVNPQ